MSLIQAYDVVATDSNEELFIAMGWLRLLGYLKLQVSFAKEPYTRDDILQKIPVI